MCQFPSARVVYNNTEINATLLRSGQILGYNITPKKSMDAPTGEWNYMEIKLFGNKVSVWLNGEWIIEDAEMPSIAPEGPIALQHHGTPLWFRNIQIKVLE